MKIKKCECGSTDFIINEGIGHRAEIGEDGELTVYKSGYVNEIEEIKCRYCEREFGENQFKQINF